MFCTKCGASNNAGTNNCVQCGEPLIQNVNAAQNNQNQTNNYPYHHENFGNYYGQNEQNRSGELLEKPMSVGDWLITTLLLLIPFVNIVLIFVWAFSKDEPLSKSNFFKAQLILMAIVMGLGLVFLILALFVFALAW